MIDFAPGMRTIIRDEEWMVKKIETNSLGNKTLYCVGISPLVKDREAIFLTDLEEIQIVDPAEVKLVADTSPFYKRALLYLESQWRQQIPTDANLHIGHKAAMDLMPYQLDPAKLALQRPRQRILIADTVGLGKTLEAGILMSELIARGKGKRILVVTVKSMMTQFQKEMWNRFTIPLVRLDSNRIQKIRANLPSNYNPFFYYDKTIVSIDTLKRDVEYRTHLENAYWDIIVIDEAQNVAERGDHQAQRSRLAKLLADRSDTMIMLSATPHPMFAVKKLTATQTTHKRAEALENAVTRKMYFSEYEMLSGEQAFLNAVQNYADLKGQQTNLFKCFLPQSWMYNSKSGVAAFVHPEGVYDDPKGGALREKLYPRLRYHFQFANERKLFPEVDHHTQFSLNVYGGPLMVSFDTISNLYDAKSIVECYEGDAAAPIPGIKDEDGDWNVKGHPDRVIHVTKKELAVFAKLFDGNDNWKQAKLPQLHAKQLIETLECFADSQITVGSLEQKVFTTTMWEETSSQDKGLTKRDVHFPESTDTLIYSGPHIGVANPLFKTSRRICRLNSDYDNLDLLEVDSHYLQRCNYIPVGSPSEYCNQIPKTIDGHYYTDDYRVVMRKMLNQGGERTLIAAIIPPKTKHIDGIFGITIEDVLLLGAFMASIPYDFLIKAGGKANGRYDSVSNFPWKCEESFLPELRARALLLNALNDYYTGLVKKTYQKNFSRFTWSKSDPRLANTKFSTLTSEWTWNTPLRTDYERRQALRKYRLRRKNMRRWSMNIAAALPPLLASLLLIIAFM